MPKYECSRQVECVVIIEAENDMDLRRKLGKVYGSPDDLVENADTIVFAENWNVVQDGSERGVLVMTDPEIEHAVENEPEPWVGD
jgi:hypothetical protein